MCMHWCKYPFFVYVCACVHARVCVLWVCVVSLGYCPCLRARVFSKSVIRERAQGCAGFYTSINPSTLRPLALAKDPRGHYPTG
jgi:hypothetical protein